MIHKIHNLFLHHFLSKIKMEKYYYKLQNNGFDDLNLLITQTKTENPITDLQLKEIGINNMIYSYELIKEINKLFKINKIFETRRNYEHKTKS